MVTIITIYIIYIIIVKVTINERVGKSGRGIVIQDVQAPPAICMDRIRDLPHYHKMVPKVKSIDVYSEEKFTNVIVVIFVIFTIEIIIKIVNYSYYYYYYY